LYDRKRRGHRCAVLSDQIGAIPAWWTNSSSGYSWSPMKVKPWSPKSWSADHTSDMSSVENATPSRRPHGAPTGAPYRVRSTDRNAKNTTHAKLVTHSNTVTPYRRASSPISSYSGYLSGAGSDGGYGQKWLSRAEVVVVNER
jgi:hypothetical protein